MKIFVVGAAGFIGFNIATLLRRKGYEVYGLTRSPEKAKRLMQHEIIPVIGSMQDESTYQAVAEKCAVMIHAAADYANDQFGFDKKIIKAFFDTAKNSPERKTLIYTSGVWVYGDSNGKTIDESTPLNPADNVKGREEVEALVMSDKNVRSIILRPSMVYGKQGSLTNLWCDDAKRGDFIRVIGDGTNHYPMVHVDDLAQAFLLALESDVDHEAFNLAEDAHFTVNDVVAAIVKASDFKGEIKHLTPEEAESYVGGMAKPLAFDLHIDSQKAKRMLGWQVLRHGFVEEVERYYLAWKASR